MSTHATLANTLIRVQRELKMLRRLVILFIGIFRIDFDILS